MEGVFGIIAAIMTVTVIGLLSKRGKTDSTALVVIYIILFLVFYFIVKYAFFLAK